MYESGYGFIERSLYMNSVHDEIMKHCTQRDLILDFGCGKNYLKRRHPRFNIIGFDINPKFSEVKNYITVNADIIVCCHVLEHIDESSIKKILKNFKKIAPKKLIIASPTENILSKLYVNLFNHELHKGHITKLEEINKILKMEGFLCIRKKRIFTLTELSILEIGK